MSALKEYNNAKKLKKTFQFQEAIACHRNVIEHYPDTFYAEQSESDILELEELIKRGQVQSSLALFSMRFSLFTIVIFAANYYRLIMGVENYRNIELVFYIGILFSILSLVFGLLGLQRITKYEKFLSGIGYAKFSCVVGVVALIGSLIWYFIS